MSIVFAERPQSRARLLPLTYTRPISQLRLGILTIAEKWLKSLKIDHFGHYTADYLQHKFPLVQTDPDTLWIIDAVLPVAELLHFIQQLQTGEAIAFKNKLIAARGIHNPLLGEGNYTIIHYTGLCHYPERTWDLFKMNGAEIRNDYKLLTSGRISQPLHDPCTSVYGTEIFLETGASVKAAILNAENGPIYLGKNSEVHEGSIIRGPFAMGEGSIIAMGAKMRGDISAGPFCKLGGEVSNCIFQAYSNKGHDGFLGNSVIGEWCNFGAGTNNSNLKNNYDPVRMWDYDTDSFIHTGLQFCGLIMGDHSKAAISTMFNTGSTVGVACNIYGAGFQKTHIPSFSWGGADDAVTHRTRKAFITAEVAMQRRNLNLSEEEKGILHHIFESSARYRAWEN